MGTEASDRGRRPSTVARNIRRIRERQNRSAASLAERASRLLGRTLSRSSLSQVELGNRGLDVEELEAIAHVLKTPVADFFKVVHHPESADDVLVRYVGGSTDTWLPEVDRAVRRGEVIAVPKDLAEREGGLLAQPANWQRDEWSVRPVSAVLTAGAMGSPVHKHDGDAARAHDEVVSVQDILARVEALEARLQGTAGG